MRSQWRRLLTRGRVSGGPTIPWCHSLVGIGQSDPVVSQGPAPGLFDDMLGSQPKPSGGLFDDMLGAPPQGTAQAVEPTAPPQGVQMFSQALAQMQPGNIDISNRPVVHNPDGTVSTELSFSKDFGNGEVLLPRVINGQVVSQDQAVQHYHDTGENLGTFPNPQLADAYAEALHNRFNALQASPARPDTGGIAEWLQNIPQGMGPMSQEEMSRTGQTQFEPSAVTAGTTQDPINNQPLIPPYLIRPALEAGMALNPATQIPYLMARAFAPQQTEGVTQGGADALAGFTTVNNLPWLAAGAVMPEGVAGKVGQTALAAYFEAQAIQHTPELWQAYQASTDPSEKSKLLTQMGVSLGLPVAMLHGVMGGEPSGATEAPVNAPEAPVARSVPETVSPEPQAAAPVESQTQRYRFQEPSASELTAANQGLQDKGEPVPRAQVGGEAPKVREAISLDELRLMRERSDLQLQNELSKRATGNTHPAIDDRISQINDELDNIANRELAAQPDVPEGTFDTLRQPPSVDVAQEAPRTQPGQPQRPIPTPDEQIRQVATIAESPEATTPGDIARGQQPIEGPRPAGVGQPEIGDVSATERQAPA